MRAFLSTGLLLLLAGSCYANELPDAPKPKTVDRKFVLVYGLLGAAKTLDAISTVQWLNRGPAYVETNPIFGPRPSTGRLVGINLGYLAGEVAMGYALKRFGGHHRWAKVFWLVEPSFQTSQHVVFATRNFRH